MEAPRVDFWCAMKSGGCPQRNELPYTIDVLREEARAVSAGHRAGVPTSATWMREGKRASDLHVSAVQGVALAANIAHLSARITDACALLRGTIKENTMASSCCAEQLPSNMLRNRDAASTASARAFKSPAPICRPCCSILVISLLAPYVEADKNLDAAS
jgi:hypothetical protein